MEPPTVNVVLVLIDNVTPGPPVTELLDCEAWVNVVETLVALLK